MHHESYVRLHNSEIKRCFGEQPRRVHLSFGEVQATRRVLVVMQVLDNAPGLEIDARSRQMSSFRVVNCWFHRKPGCGRFGG